MIFVNYPGQLAGVISVELSRSAAEEVVFCGAWRDGLDRALRAVKQIRVGQPRKT
jgi:hypothetical protein